MRDTLSICDLARKTSCLLASYVDKKLKWSFLSKFFKVGPHCFKFGSFLNFSPDVASQEKKKSDLNIVSKQFVDKCKQAISKKFSRHKKHVELYTLHFSLSIIRSHQSLKYFGIIKVICCSNCLTRVIQSSFDFDRKRVIVVSGLVCTSVHRRIWREFFPSCLTECLWCILHLNKYETSAY